MAAAESNIAPFIRTLRGQRVIFDHDLAALYGVPTKQFNQAFKRNRDRFPEEFAFQLSPAEFSATNWSQSAASSRQDIGNQVLDGGTMSSRMRMRKHRGAAYLPWAFTEHGALMAANILRSPRAREMSVFIIRAFVRMREELVANSAILTRLAEIDRTLLVHDTALRELYEKLSLCSNRRLKRPSPGSGSIPVIAEFTLTAGSAIESLIPTYTIRPKLLDLTADHADYADIKSIRAISDISGQ